VANPGAPYIPLPYTRDSLIAILQKDLDFLEYYRSKYRRKPSRNGRIFNVFMEWCDNKITEFPMINQLYKPKRMFVVVEGWHTTLVSENGLE
jgi:hypothetical protein